MCTQIYKYNLMRVFFTVLLYDFRDNYFALVNQLGALFLKEANLFFLGNN